jgi:hypothetical protein
MACKAGNMRKQKNPHPGTPTREYAPSLETLEVSRAFGGCFADLDKQGAVCYVLPIAIRLEPIDMAVVLNAEGLEEESEGSSSEGIHWRCCKENCSLRLLLSHQLRQR